jgi:hypothetical protein
MPCLTSCSRSSSLILPRRALRASAKAGLPDSGSSALKKLSAADDMSSVAIVACCLAKDGCETDEGPQQQTNASSRGKQHCNEPSLVLDLEMFYCRFSTASSPGSESILDYSTLHFPFP